MNRILLSILLCGLVVLFPVKSQAVVVDDSVIFQAKDKRYFDGIQFYDNNKTEEINVIFEVDTNVNTAMKNIGDLYEKNYAIENLTKRNIHVHGNGLNVTNYGKGGESYGNKDGAAIYNNKYGKLTFCNHISVALKNISCLENYGALTFNSIVDIGQEQDEFPSGNVAIRNFGNLNINSGASISAVKHINGERRNGVAIYNSGVLNIDAIISANAPNRIVTSDSVLNSVHITGDIVHESGTAVTKIKLDGAGRFNGHVLGSDDNFTLIIDGAYWFVDRMQADYIVDGVALNNNGAIILPMVKSYEENVYTNLTLRNFTSDGNFNLNCFNGFDISTNVLASKGSRVNFIGSTPNVTIPVRINDAISGEVINDTKLLTTDNEVIVATVPADSLMRLRIEEPYLNVEGGYCKAIIKEKLVGDKRQWCFLGWEFHKY